MIEGFKSIARYIADRTGRSISPDAMRKAASHPDRPLPVDRFRRRVAARPADLDRWIEMHRQAA